MKTKTLFLALSFLLAGATSFAGNGEQLFKKKINSHIQYPEVKGEKMDTEVYVQFTVQESGAIVIDSISSGSAEISAAISEQIKALNVNPADKDVIGKTFYYRFLLKVQ